MTRRAAGHDAPSIEELGLPFPVSLDLRTIAPAHAVAVADEHPVTWELTYRQRAASSNVDRIGPNAGTGPELLEILLGRAEAIAVAQTPEPEPPSRRRKS